MESQTDHEKIAKTFEQRLSRELKKKYSFCCFLSKFSKYYYFDEVETTNNSGYEYMYKFTYNITTDKWNLDHLMIGEFTRPVSNNKDYFEIIESYNEDLAEGINKTFELYQSHQNYKDELDYEE